MTPRAGPNRVSSAASSGTGGKWSPRAQLRLLAELRVYFDSEMVLLLCVRRSSLTSPGRRCAGSSATLSARRSHCFSPRTHQRAHFTKEQSEVRRGDRQGELVVESALTSQQCHGSWLQFVFVCLIRLFPSPLPPPHVLGHVV